MNKDENIPIIKNEPLKRDYGLEGVDFDEIYSKYKLHKNKENKKDWKRTKERFVIAILLFILIMVIFASQGMNRGILFVIGMMILPLFLFPVIMLSSKYLPSPYEETINQIKKYEKDMSAWKYWEIRKKKGYLVFYGWMGI